MGATNKAVKHKYSECSSMGDCDTSSGECSCFDGYEGAGCRRMSCPDNCNRHGTCETLADVALGNSWAAGYTGWDAEKIQRCVCDPGYTGHSCEKRMCMKGDDPMTTGEVNAAYYINVADECTAEATARTDEVVLKFTDWRGETWYTYPISVNADLTNVVLEEALNALPNRAVEGVTASCDLTANDRCTITFGNRNTGAQNLEVVTTVCNTAGCQPKSKGLSTTSCTVAIASATTGTTEHTECSNRGTCDTDTGLCVCSDGFTGDACQTQTVIL